MDDAETCALCTKNAHLRCTGCLTTFYCSKEHQKQHWRQHKQACSAYKICRSADFGRIIIATRDLKPGEVIVQEAPLVLAPAKFTKSLCLGCNILAETLTFRCPRCEWPLCSEKCQDSPEHEPECYMFRQRSRKPSASNLILQAKNADVITQIVGVLRCAFLKFTSFGKYQACLNLQAVPHGEARNAYIFIAKTLLDLFDFGEPCYTLQADEPDSEPLLNEVLHICGIFSINSHELPIRNPGLQAVYRDASMLQHSCVANSSKHFDESGRIFIRAAIPVRKGEPVAINYSDPMWGTASRQSHLRQTKYFTCRCARCADPKELGTNFSSIICKNCSSSQGYLSPVDPTASDGAGVKSSWQCSVCKESEAGEYVNTVIKSIGEELLKLDRGSVQACVKFLKKHLQNLHQNHFFLMDVRLSLVQMIGKAKDGSKTEDKEKELVLKQKLCVELMEVINVISPGVSRLRAVVLYELQSALSQYARKKYLSGEITQAHLKNIYKEVRNNLRECIQIFSFEPPCLPEGQLAAIARLDLLEGDVFVESLGKQEGGEAAAKALVPDTNS